MPTKMTFLDAAQAWASRLKRDGLTLWFSLRDPRTPWLARALAWLVVAYALSPIDLIPDFIPVLGLLDDLILVPLGVALAMKLTPDAILADARRRAEADAAKPVSRTAAVVIVLAWTAAIVLAWGWWRQRG